MTLPTNAPVADVVAVPFRGGEVLTVDVNGKPYVVLRPAFESIGLDADQQVRKTQRQHWARTKTLTVQASDGRPRDMVTADLRTFLMALATIPVARVAKDVQDALKAYQNEVADVIEAYWTKGSVENPRLSTQSALLAITAQSEIERAAVARAQIELLGVAVSTGLLDKLWATGKTHIIAARGIGEEAELPAELKPLYVPDFIKSKGVTKKRDIISIQSWFGIRVGDLCRLNNVEVPEKRPREQIDGTMRDTIAWRVEHLPQFEQVWKTFYAEKYDRPMALMLDGMA